MKTAIISVTILQELLRDVRETVGEGNLSAYVTRGLERQLRADRLAAFLAELDRELGPVPADELAAVRRAWHDEAHPLIVIQCGTARRGEGTKTVETETSDGDGSAEHSR